MKLKFKVLVLFFAATIGTIRAEKTCNEIHLATESLLSKSTTNYYTSYCLKTGGEGSIVVIDDDLVINSNGNGNIIHVQIQFLSGTIVDAFGEPGKSEQCTHSMSSYDHSTYHIVVTTVSGQFSGNVVW